MSRQSLKWCNPATWKTIFIACATCLILVGALNLVVDPFGIYGTDLFPTLVFNRYQNFRDLFDKNQPLPRALVMGSSRVGCIDPDVVTEITGRKCFNWGVPEAESEILYSVLRMVLDEYNAPIDLIIVSVEPEVFHPTKRIHPQAQLSREYTRYFLDESELTAFIEKIKRLFTFEQTRSSIYVLRRKAAGREVGDWMIWRTDGFPVGFIEERVPARWSDDPETHLEKAIERFPETYFRFSEFDGLSDARKIYWEEFLRICNENDIQIYVFMPPPHPKLLDKLIEIGAEHLFIETAAYLEYTVSGAGGTFRDYTDVSSFAGDPEGFHDQIHIDPENGEAMVRDLLADFHADNSGEDE